MEELIKSFLADTYGSGDGSGYGYGDGDGYGSGDGDGSGYGDGDGSGYGDGSGDGYGYGYGYGYGDGDGDGSGYGDGYGYGYGSLLSVTKVGEDRIYNIDDVPTAIDSIKGNIAKGRILNADMTFTPCWIVRIGNSFAHGETLHDAQRDAQQKHMRSASEEDRLKMFVEQFPSPDEKIPAKSLFDWHNILTGSCLMGRKHWCEQAGIDIEKDTFTVKEFIKLTKDAYGGSTIKKLTEQY